jgi:hypothetical protein
MHRLAETIAAERKRFRREPDHWRTRSDRRGHSDDQLELPLGAGEHAQKPDSTTRENQVP